MKYICKECKDRGIEEVEFWNEKLLKEKGEPVCQECDSDMELELTEDK